MDSITIILQLKDLHVIDGQQTGFIVQAITESGASISYQWQKSTTPNIWKNVGINSNILGFVASIGLNGSKYRVILTSGSRSTGLTVLESVNVTLYVSPKPSHTPTPTMTPTPTSTPTKPRIYIPGVKDLVLDQAANRLYASGGDSIKVINTTNNQIISSFNVSYPINIWKILSSESNLYVSDTINNQILQRSKSSGYVEKTTNIDAYPMDMKLADETLYALCTSHRENSLKKVQNGQIIQSMTLSENSMDRFVKLIVNQNNNKAYVLDASSESIIVVNLRYMIVEKTINLPKHSKPESMEIDASSNLIYIPIKYSGFYEILILNTNNNSILGSRITVPYNQSGKQANILNFFISPTRNNLYATDAYQSWPLLIMNTNTQVFISSIQKLSGGCSSMAYDAILNKLYVANGSSGIDIVQL